MGKNADGEGEREEEGRGCSFGLEDFGILGGEDRNPAPAPNRNPETTNPTELGQIDTTKLGCCGDNRELLRQVEWEAGGGALFFSFAL